MASFDGIIVGGGHNGLTCAAYLARAGLRVAVVERNAQIGGGCSTEEVTLPGFRHNLHSNYHFFEEGPIARDLQLERYGLRYIYPAVQHAMVFRDGTAVTVHRDPQKTADSFARFSRHDAEHYLDLHHHFAIETRELMNQYLFSRPLVPSELMARVKGALLTELVGYSRQSLYEAVDANFDEERIRTLFKSLLNTSAIENLPYMGLAFPRMLSLVFRAGLPIGGAFALPRALARIVEECGGTIVRNAHVARIIVHRQRATGVELADGSVLEATRFVASGIDAPQTVRLTGEENFPAPITKKMQDFQWAGHSLVTLHVALEEPPRYAAAEFDPDVDMAFDTMLGADNAQDLTDAFAAIKRHELPPRLVGSSACNTRYDPSMAPPGKHVAFWWPFAPYELGESAAAWDDCKADITARMLDEWRAFAPNLGRANVLGTYLFSPLDIERNCINMVRGSHHVGAYTLDQFGYTRPIPEMANYRTPVDGLYLCGASSHPGGAVTGGPGYICAGTITEDLQIPRWWTPIPLPAWDGVAPEALVAATP